MNLIHYRLWPSESDNKLFILDLKQLLKKMLNDLDKFESIRSVNLNTCINFDFQQTEINGNIRGILKSNG